MNLIEKWADKMIRRSAWKSTKIENNKKQKSKSQCRNDFKAFLKHKDVGGFNLSIECKDEEQLHDILNHIDESDNLYNKVIQEIQQKEDTER